MSGNKIEVTFYHSVICPRCRFSGLMLRNALRKHPNIDVRKVEFLADARRARSDGVKSFPALVAQGRTLAGFVLTQGRIERFLASLTIA